MASLSESKSLSEILVAEPNTSTIGNVNIIDIGDDGEPTAICYLPYLTRFTNNDGPTNSVGQYEGLAAILLAMEHLNTGNGTIVPELDGIDQRCPLRFTTKAFDTEAQKRVGLDHVITLTDGRTQDLFPTAILGATSSSISISTSTLSGLRGVPQISPISTSAALDDESLFGRTIPNDDGTAIPLLEKIASWNVRYMAVLHVDDSYGNAFARAIRLTAQREFPGLRVATEEISPVADDEKIAYAVQQLKETEFTFFFAVISPAGTLADKIMIEACNQGIAGTGLHTWLFSDAFGTTAIGRDFPVGSPLEKAYRGTGVLSAVGGIPGMDAYDKLSRSMQELGQNEEGRSYLHSLFPVADHSVFTDEETFLKAPGIIAPFVYDAAVGLGLASCGIIENSEGNEYFSGEELFEALRLNTTFEGASGSIVLNSVTGTREPHAALFSLTNFVGDELASSQGKVRFKGIETDIYKSGNWEAIAPYTFNDGTSEIPADLPLLETNPNYINNGIKTVGLILCGMVIVLALAFSGWTFRNSKRTVVRASQPIFLYLVSAGTLLMGLSIVPLGIDMGVTDQKGADVACMSFPWLLAIGFSLTFSALFTKNYRIIQIMKKASRFRRVKVTAVDVIKPMIILLITNTVVLTVWSVIDPLRHKTISVEQDTFLRDIETYGTCSSEKRSIFLAILGAINLGSLLFALFQSYMARNISTEYQESSYIFLAMAFIFIASVISIPVMVISQEKASVFYFVTANCIFVVCTSILLLVFVPKVRAVRKSNQNATNPSISCSHSGSALEGIRILNTNMAVHDLRDENNLLRQENRRLSMATSMVTCTENRATASRRRLETPRSSKFLSRSSTFESVLSIAPFSSVRACSPEEVEKFENK